MIAAVKSLRGVAGLPFDRTALSAALRRIDVPIDIEQCNGGQREVKGVAALRGGLRNVENVIRVSQMFAGGDVPDLSHLKAAIRPGNGRMVLPAPGARCKM